MQLESMTMWTYQDDGGLCETILNMSKNIQSAAIINKQGRVETSSLRDPSEPLSIHTSELFLMHCVLQISMGRDFDEQYGPINYHISERPNMTVLTFPLEDGVVMVSVNKDISPISLAKKITRLLVTNKELLTEYK